jgi:hypothetical protein
VSENRDDDSKSGADAVFNSIVNNLAGVIMLGGLLYYNVMIGSISPWLYLIPGVLIARGSERKYLAQLILAIFGGKK